MTGADHLDGELMTRPVFAPEDVPNHVLSIPELDLTADLFARRLAGPWFRLAAWTIARSPHGKVEEVIQRQSLLLSTEHFAEVFNDLESIGNVIDNLGSSGYTTVETGGRKTYSYTPFYRFEIPFTSIIAEPLVFFRGTTSGPDLMVNPDLWLLLGLEERTPSCGIWWDDRFGVEALRRREIDDGSLRIIEIRSDYLIKYLRVRQLSLVIAHYHHRHFYNPPVEAVHAFTSEDVTLGSPEVGAKALMQNWGLRRDLPGEPFLQRRLHLWYLITPPPLDIDDPLGNKPPFNIYNYTLPTEVGPVAPGRWANRYPHDEKQFSGELCDFMDRVYFRQEVLTKYEHADGFSVGDDGSVSCRDYWELARSTSRLGNELIATAIGDFAEGVPFDEWLHWKQYAVEPPSREASDSISAEQEIPDAVNAVATELQRLNKGFRFLARSFRGTHIDGIPWRGSLDSLAGRQLRWYYSSAAGEDEFLKRATLASTLVLDGLEAKPLRQLALAFGKSLHANNDVPPRPLASRRLLERIALIASLIEQVRPDIGAIEELVAQAEGTTNKDRSELQEELQGVARRLHEEFRPLAFLYELRIFGGLAHQPNAAKARIAAVALGLPEKNWQRADFLRLMNLIGESVRRTATRLSDAGHVLRNE